jgi:hypothetical protein
VLRELWVVGKFRPTDVNQAPEKTVVFGLFSFRFGFGLVFCCCCFVCLFCFLCLFCFVFLFSCFFVFFVFFVFVVVVCLFVFFFFLGGVAQLAKRFSFSKKTLQTPFCDNSSTKDKRNGT